MFADWNHMGECLHTSGVDASTVSSIREVCELSGLSPDQVGGFNEAELVERLYLTKKEASAVMDASTNLGCMRTESFLHEPLEAIRETRETADSLPEVEAQADQSAVFSHRDLQGVISPHPSAEPSFMRRTASARAHEAPSPDCITPSQRSQRSSQTLRRSMASPRSSTLFAPTAAFLNRLAGERKDLKPAGADSAYKGGSSLCLGRGSLGFSTPMSLSSSMMTENLNAVLDRPAGQRATKAKPFNFNAETRIKGSQLLSQEEQDLMEAKHQFKRNQVPQHVHEARPVEISRAPKSTPKSPQSLFKPFNLASENRGAKKQEKQVEMKKQEESCGRHTFKATPFNSTIFDKAPPSAKKSSGKLTVGVAPSLKSVERAKVHELVPKAETDMTESEKARMELRKQEAAEEQKRQEEEAEAKRIEAFYKETPVEDLRKSMVFKATRMPNFSAPFRPSSNTKSATQSIEFNFTTDGRLGKALSFAEREDMAGTRISSSNFSQSLRHPLSSAALGNKNHRSVCLNQRMQSSTALPANRSSDLKTALGVALQAMSPRPGGVTHRAIPAMASPRMTVV
eukprot:gene19207-25825_t